jgi:isocitrate/isopropylmalate dehydrogenase
MSNTIPVTLIPGDGIGPEIVDATLAALDALRAPFDWDRQIAGLGGIKAAGDPLPAATLDSIRRTRLALKGPLETPSGGGYRSSNVRLREEFPRAPSSRVAVSTRSIWWWSARTLKACTSVTSTTSRSMTTRVP